MTSSSSAWKQHATWQDGGGDGKDGVKWHKDRQKNMGNIKILTANWIFKKQKDAGKCKLDSLRLCVLASGWAWSDTSAGWSNAATTSHVNKAGWGVRSHVAHPSEHTQAWAVLLSAGGKEDLSSMGEMSLIHRWLTDMPLFPFHHRGGCSDWYAWAFFRSVVHPVRIYREHLHSSQCPHTTARKPCYNKNSN